MDTVSPLLSKAKNFLSTLTRQDKLLTDIVMSPTESPRFSTLEPAERDIAAEAPERDHALVAPQNPRGLDAPQTAPAQYPETFYDKVALEALSHSETGSKTTTSSLSPTPLCPISANITIFLSVVIAAVVVGVSVGVGVGVGLRNRRNSQNPSTALPNTVTMTAASRSTSTFSPTFTPKLIAKGIMDDSSLAAVELSNGDRLVFFQEDTGVIRQGVYSESTNSWKADLGYTVALDGKTIRL